MTSYFKNFAWEDALLPALKTCTYLPLSRFLHKMKKRGRSDCVNPQALRARLSGGWRGELRA